MMGREENPQAGGEGVGRGGKARTSRDDVGDRRLPSLGPAPPWEVTSRYKLLHEKRVVTGGWSEDWVEEGGLGPRGRH